MTELEQLLAMFERAGIPFQRYDDEERRRIQIEVAPPRRNEEDVLRVGGPLTGVSWASTDYYFSPDGLLVGIHMEGD